MRQSNKLAGLRVLRTSDYFLTARQEFQPALVSARLQACPTDSFMALIRLSWEALARDTRSAV